MKTNRFNVYAYGDYQEAHATTITAEAENNLYDFKTNNEARLEGIKYFKRNRVWNLDKINRLFRLMAWDYEDPDRMDRNTAGGTIIYLIDEEIYQLYCENSERGLYDSFGTTPEKAAEGILRKHINFYEERAIHLLEMYGYEDYEPEDFEYMSYEECLNLGLRLLDEDDMKYYLKLVQAIDYKKSVGLAA